MDKAVTILKKEDPRYPERLREIHNPPECLFVKGQVELLQEPQIAIVGCRHLSAYGAENAFQFAKALSEIGLTITSGLAIGIDTLAHQGALAGQGQTIAVLGAGLGSIYPKQNEHLANEISLKGALVSEFSFHTPPLRHNFPKRNRIISGLSLGVLVIEAAEKSGSLITARFALEQNREIFALPGSIHSPTSRGCHQLIKEGAILVDSLADLLLHIKEKLLNAVKNDQLQNKKKHDNSIKKRAHPLLAFFLSTPTPLDVLLARTGTSIESLNAELLMLELSGAIEKVAGGYKIK